MLDTVCDLGVLKKCAGMEGCLMSNKDPFLMDQAQNEPHLCTQGSADDLLSPTPLLTSMPAAEFRTRKATLLLMASHLFDKMASYMVSFVPLILSLLTG